MLFGKNSPGAAFFKDRRAVAAVEFALVFPLFIAVVFGIIVFGSYLVVVHGVQQLAAEAARSSIAGLTDSERASLAQSYVTTNLSYYPLISPSRVSVSAAPSSGDGNVFVVTVQYDDSNSLIYLLPQFIPTPSPTIVESAAIPRGGF
jgi:Flp pilus assembly protein TadG